MSFTQFPEKQHAPVDGGDSHGAGATVQFVPLPAQDPVEPMHALLSKDPIQLLCACALDSCIRIECSRPEPFRRNQEPRKQTDQKDSLP